MAEPELPGKKAAANNRRWWRFVVHLSQFCHLYRARDRDRSTDRQTDRPTDHATTSV